MSLTVSYTHLPCRFPNPSSLPKFSPILINSLKIQTPRKFSSFLFPALSSSISSRPYTFSSFPNSRGRRFKPFVNAAASRKSSKSDYYSVLDLNKNASLDEIKASYRKLARKVLNFTIMTIFYFIFFFNRSYAIEL